jgi:mannose-1-phosphate guanylyltransferase/mannose-1-phosphate guanylyltransferase/mannose-6-phosphate isomerase
VSAPVRPDIVPVLLAGGSGTRLWPLSRETVPKQLVALVGAESLLQATARRLLRAAPPERVVCIANEGQAHLVRTQLQTVDPALGGHLILEPQGRNTAAAIAVAALHAAGAFGPETVLWVCPSDHLVRDPDALLAALDLAAGAAAAGDLVTFGIRPGRPETGFGYIQMGAALPDRDGVLRAAAFVEKPPAELAEKMIATGDHVWNSGMFVWRADRILAELRAHAPAPLTAVETAWAARTTGSDGTIRLPADSFGAVPAEPIDKAVMERSARVAVVPVDPGWSDLGSWQSVWEEAARDADGNAVAGDGLVVEGSGCFVRAEGRLVVCAGLRDVAVIETPDAVLVADRTRGDVVRAAVGALAGVGRKETKSPAAEQRPWGSFQVLHAGEDWAVVKGVARVTVDGKVSDLSPGESVDIPLGAVHRMANPGEVPMHLIEVQRGDYLGEDDIVRYEDVYGRS